MFQPNRPSVKRSSIARSLKAMCSASSPNAESISPGCQSSCPTTPRPFFVWENSASPGRASAAQGVIVTPPCSMEATFGPAVSKL